MSRFNLDDYETVADRLTRFWHDYPEGRIVTETVFELCHDNRWVVKATVSRHGIGQDIAATGLAEETVGEGMVNESAALENCETSAIGRALANMGYSTSKSRASREEMEKVQRYEEQPKEPRELTQLKMRFGLEAAYDIWNRGAKDGLTPAEILKSALAAREPEIEHVTPSPPPLAEEDAVEPTGGGDSSPSSPPAAPADTPEDPGEAWAELLSFMDTHPDVRWVKDDIHAWIKQLFALMTVTQLWSEKALQATLAEHHPDMELWKGERHVSTLKKDEMLRFADLAFEAAKQRIAEEGT